MSISCVNNFQFHNYYDPTPILIATEHLVLSGDSDGEQDRSDTVHPHGTHRCPRPAASPLHHLPPHLHRHPGGEPGDDDADSLGLSTPHSHVLFPGESFPC